MILPGYRSNDAVITICQDNGKKSIEIKEINKPAEQALGYEVSAVSGQPLARFLPERIQTLLAEYVEYDDVGNDVGNVLSKVQSFCVINQSGREVAFRLKVLRSESSDKQANFRLILQDRAGNRQSAAFRAILHENFKGHEILEPHTSLSDRNSLTKNLELVQHYVGKEALRSCFAVVEIDQFDALLKKHGETVCFALLKHLSNLARQSLRGDDAISFVSPSRLGLILMDTNTESARIVLNRLRWLMAATPMTVDDKEPLPVTVSIAFRQVGPHGSVASEKGLIDEVEAALAAQAGGAGNQLVEMAE